MEKQVRSIAVTENNIATLRDAQNDLGIINRLAGTSKALARDIAAEEQLLTAKQRQLDAFKQGDSAGAILETTAAYQRQQEIIRQDLATAGQKLDTAENVTRIVRDGAILAGATIVTGGVAAKVAVAGAATAAAAGIGAGTAAGATLGAATAGTEGVLHIALGNKSAEEALADAGAQVGQDIKNSAIASVGTVTGLNVATRVGGAVSRQAAVHLAEKTARITTAAASGASAGVVNASVMSTAGITEQLVAAHREFANLVAERNLTPEQYHKERQEFLAERGLGLDQLSQQLGRAAALGMIGGALGGTGAALRTGTTGVSTLAVEGGEFASHLVVGTADAAIAGQMTAETIAQNTVSAAIGGLTGRLAQRQPQPTRRPTGAESLNKLAAQESGPLRRSLELFAADPKLKKTPALNDRQGQFLVRALAETDGKPARRDYGVVKSYLESTGQKPTKSNDPYLANAHKYLGDLVEARKVELAHVRDRQPGKVLVLRGEIEVLNNLRDSCNPQQKVQPRMQYEIQDTVNGWAKNPDRSDRLMRTMELATRINQGQEGDTRTFNPSRPYPSTPRAEGQRIMEVILANSSKRHGPNSAPTAKAHSDLGRQSLYDAGQQGNNGDLLAQAKRHFTAAEKICKSIGDAPGQAEALRQQGLVARQQGDPDFNRFLIQADAIKLPARPDPQTG